MRFLLVEGNLLICCLQYEALFICMGGMILGNKGVYRFFAIFVVFILFLSLLSPMNVAADELDSSNSDESALLANQAILEQLLLRQGKPRLHDELKGLSGSQKVGVIVHLSENPVALEQGIAELQGKTFSNSDASVAKEIVLTQQEAVVQEMVGENISFTQGSTYDTVLNGFAAEVRASDLSKLLSIEGITLVEPDVEVYTAEVQTTQADGQIDAQMNVTNDFLGIGRLWEKGYEGQGIKVAVLDTGIDVDHPDLKPIYKGGKNFIQDNPTLYKVPRNQNDGSETKPSERHPSAREVNDRGSTFATSHGTHVAGTIAAIGVNELGVKGIAPQVDLYSYRVLGAYGSGATSGIIAAIEYAVNERMDVINLSLGGGSNTEIDAGSFAINNAMLAGVISVIATGNDGPERGTMGTPATAPLGIAVGNSTKPELQTEVSTIVTVGNQTFSEDLTLITLPQGANVAELLSGEYDLVNIPGLGKPENFAGIDVEGKIALISRGEISFIDKVANAKAEGAIGAIIYNNATGPLTNAFQGESPIFIPAFGMSLEKGQAIKQALVTGAGKVSFNIHTYISYDQINDSSSRGPSVPNFDIKPDVVAPGTNILSTVPTYDLLTGEPLAANQIFGQKTGTSMATPHIAGIAALMKQANPTWSPFDIKVALSNTAKVLDGYDVFEQGAGRVNAYDAAFPSALAYVQDEALRDQTNEIVPNIKGTVTFGPQPIKEQNILVQRQIVVKDMKGLGGRYQVTINTLKGFGDAVVSVDKPSIVLAPNGQETITVTLQASKNDNAQFGDEMFGYIYITPTEPALTTSSLLVNQATLTVRQGEQAQLNVFEKTTQTHGYYTEISLPFAADFSVITDIKDFSISANDLSFATSDDTATVSFEITRPVDEALVYLRNLEKLNVSAPIATGAIGYVAYLENLQAGRHSRNIGPEYADWENNIGIVPEGVYSVDFIGWPASGGEIRSWTGDAVIVKRTAPTVNATVTSSDTGGVVLSGQVTDKYIDYNKTLKDYGLDYKLNSKLKAEYAVNDNTPVAFILNEDGSFSLGIQGVSTTADTVKVIVTDAVNNKGEVVAQKVNTFEISAREPELNAAEQIVSRAHAKYIQASLTPYIAKASTNDRVTDVTKEATYSVANSNMVEVKNGLVYGKSLGTTTITVSYNGQTVEIPVTVIPNNSAGGWYPGGGGGAPEAQPEEGKSESEKPQIEIPQPEEQENKSPFIPVDLSANHWAAGYIQQMIERGLLRGNESGEVKPNANVTRAQFASIIARALGLTADGKAPFSDIGNYAAETQEEITAIFEAGIARGTDGKYMPSGEITRAQLALMLYRAYEHATGEKYVPKGQATFADLGKYNEETMAAIAMLQELNIAAGDKGKFMPTAPATRAHAAKMVIHFLEIVENR